MANVKLEELVKEMPDEFGGDVILWFLHHPLCLLLYSTAVVLLVLYAMNVI